MAEQDIVKEAQALRLAFKSRSRLKLEFLGLLSRLLREHGVEVSDEALRSLVVAAPGELPGEVITPAAAEGATSNLTALADSPPQGGEATSPPQGGGGAGTSPPQGGGGGQPPGSPPQGGTGGSPPQGGGTGGSPPQGGGTGGSPPQGGGTGGSPPQGSPPQGSPPQGSPPQGSPPQGGQA